MSERDCLNCIRNIPGKGCTVWDCDYINRKEAVDLIKGLVRCKDCRHYEIGTGWAACGLWSGDPYEQAATDPDDFCSRGEKKNDE